ncbi:unnamed protein product [Arctia plantaginis]|uniref:Uncharacterized protein n=1 Tax=Arctia plantaginis TaxID=874455 RepID=A0A8S0ZN08_ARCPL|nr:unnamed protein product [Arctia plantaginis]
MTSIWLLLGIAIVAQAHIVKKVDSDDAELPDELEWPDEYTLKAMRMSLTDNVIENYEIWRTEKSSRIDYNDGYVKSIVLADDNYRYGVKYSIHPEASRSQDVETACASVIGDKYDSIAPETILPLEAYNYESAGKETIQDKDCVKFKYDSTEDGTEKRRTIWATYDTSSKIWIPVRLEILEFSVWLGSKNKHDIIDYYDFVKSFSAERVFDVEDYNCPGNETAAYTSHSEAISKNLLFADPDKKHHIDNLFHSFKKDFTKVYADENEHSMRKSVFKSNVRRVIEHNRRNLGYKLALNQFADKTPKEMRKFMGLNRRPEGKVGNIPFPYNEDKLKDLSNDLPSEYDARLLGLVSKVKNQEECGSCWTFGTTAAVEGALARVNGGRLLALSNQALVDCAWAFGAAGCDGGTDNAAYEWMMEYGLPTEAEYGPYLNQDGVCKILNTTKIYPIRGYTDVTPLSVGALKVALVNHGPLSVSVDVTPSFSLYSSGIFYDITCKEQELNHEVTLVGYGERDGDTFWILKNSWGPTWGIGGYMYISARDNNCGVATEPTYVVF